MNYKLEIQDCNTKIKKYNNLIKLIDELFPNQNMFLEDIDDFKRIITKYKITMKFRKKALKRVNEENHPSNKE